jgi:DNA-binding Lrp family transcriptional regulator
MDELDERLLELLRENARESYVNLAKELSTSEGTVRGRLKRLVDEGVISRFTIRTTGANIKAVIEVSIETNVHTGELTGRIAQWKGVDAVYEVSGDFDIMIVAQARDTEELNEIIEKIRELPHVQSTRSRLILKEV